MYVGIKCKGEYFLLMCGSGVWCVVMVAASSSQEEYEGGGESRGRAMSCGCGCCVVCCVMDA